METRIEAKHWSWGVNRIEKVVEHFRHYQKDTQELLLTRIVTKRNMDSFEVTLEFNHEYSQVQDILNTIKQYVPDCRNFGNYRRINLNTEGFDNIIQKTGLFFECLINIKSLLNMEPPPELSLICVKSFYESGFSFESFIEIPTLLYQFNRGDYSEVLCILKIAQQYKQPEHLDLFCKLMDEYLHKEINLKEYGITNTGSFNKVNLLEFLQAVNIPSKYYEEANIRCGEILDYLFSDKSSRAEKEELFLMAVKTKNKDLMTKSYHLLCGLPNETQQNVEVSPQMLVILANALYESIQLNKKLYEENIELRRMINKPVNGDKKQKYPPDFISGNNNNNQQPDNNTPKTSVCNIQ